MEKEITDIESSPIASIPPSPEAHKMIPLELLQDVVNYLVRQPWGEVNPMIQKLANLPSPNPK